MHQNQIQITRAPQRRPVGVLGVYVYVCVLLLWPLLCAVRPAGGHSQASENAYREELVFNLPNKDRGAPCCPLSFHPLPPPHTHTHLSSPATATLAKS